MVENMSNGYRVVEYKSIEEFYRYISTAQTSAAFSGMAKERCESHTHGYRFTQTNSFDEAVSLMHNGWEEMAKKLVERLKAMDKKHVQQTMRKSIYDVAGFQPCVPRYLNGVPDAMIRQVMVPAKQKVVVINKSVSYNGGTSTDRIVEESVKVLQLVKKIEAQGVRVHLNIVLGTEEGSKKFAVKVCVKAANQRVNISKMAFMLVHPSMLRRLMFRWIETYPEVTSSFRRGYGRPSSARDLNGAFGDKEYVLPAFIDTDVEQIKSLDDMKKYKGC